MTPRSTDGMSSAGAAGVVGGCGGDRSASATVSATDMGYESPAARRAHGARFTLAPTQGPATAAAVLALLRAWRDARPALLLALEAGAAAIAAASSSGTTSTLSIVNGSELYTAPRGTGSYHFDDADPVAKAAAGNPQLAALSAPLAKSCMCLLAGPASAPAAGGGPVPPARELLAMSVSPAAIARSKMGLPLLDPVLLGQLCNATQNATANTARGTGGCQPLSFSWAGSTATLLPCNLTWEPVLLESIVARCVATQYFGSRVVADMAAAANNLSRTSPAATAAAAAANYTLTVSQGARKSI